ncbi:MAG TPA: cupin domain-containing protein [Xanthobacteraceae bacterium]|jgi:uncharacterized protein YjlB
MSLLEALKKTFETVTGAGRPSHASVAARLAPRAPHTMLFRDDGVIPNNPELPFVHYPGAVGFPERGDPAAVFEELFARNGWGDSWRNGIYDYVHYHSGTHEALGIARGHARVRFGGNSGEVVELKAGDVAVLPAGTGHQSLFASKDLLVVGAYPPGGKYDECRGSRQERERALESIPKVPVPAEDPVYGADGPLMKAWSG